MNTLSKLPSRQPFLSAYHLQVVVQVLRRERLDLVPGMGLNEALNAFYIPASLLLGDRMFRQTFQVVIIEARNGIRTCIGGIRHTNIPCKIEGHPAHELPC